MYVVQYGAFLAFLRDYFDLMFFQCQLNRSRWENKVKMNNDKGTCSFIKKKKDILWEK